MKKNLIFIVVFVFSLLAIRSDVCIAQITVFDTFKSSYVNFSIDYPFNWTVNDMGKIVTFASTRRRGSKDRFRENLVLVVESIKQPGATLQDYTRALISRLPRSVAKFKLLSSREIELQNSNAVELIYTGRSKDRIPLKFIQVVAIKDNIAYVLLFTADKGEFAKYLTEIFNPMIESFRIGISPPQQYYP